MLADQDREPAAADGRGGSRLDQGECVLGQLRKQALEVRDLGLRDYAGQLDPGLVQELVPFVVGLWRNFVGCLSTHKLEKVEA
jgi:hypothetical protein